MRRLGSIDSFGGVEKGVAFRGSDLGILSGIASLNVTREGGDGQKKTTEFKDEWNG